MKHLTIHNLATKNFTLAVRGVFEAEPGDQIMLKSADGQDLFSVEVVDLWRGPLAHAPSVLLELSLDPLARTFTGLQTQLALYRDDPQEPTTMELEITMVVCTERKSAILRPTRHELTNLNGGQE